MAYKTAELEKKAIEIIQNDDTIHFIQDIVIFMPCSKRTFYDHKLQELHTIKEGLEKNRTKTKNALRKKWFESGNATTEIALYKLIGTDEESDRINSQKTKLEGLPSTININVTSTESGEKLKKFLNGKPD